MDEDHVAATTKDIGTPARRRRVVVGSMIILLAGFVMNNASGAEQLTPSPSSNEQPPASTDQQTQSQSNMDSTDTRSGGATAASPQGDTPPGMQPIPAEPKKN